MRKRHLRAAHGISPKKARSSRGSSLGVIPHPRSFDPAIRVFKTLRFRANAGTGVFYSITTKNLLQLLVVAASSTGSYRLVQSIRIVRIETWADPAIGSAGSVAISGLGVGPENRVTDQSMGVQPAHVVWRPLPGAQNSFWLQNGATESNIQFEILASTGQVIDLTVELILQCDDTPTANADTGSGMTTGTLYCNYLDGLTSGVLQPVDFQPLP